jgi:hypothetical protein
MTEQSQRRVRSLLDVYRPVNKDRHAQLILARSCCAPLKAEYTCVDYLSLYLSSCSRAADHTYTFKWITSALPVN